MIRLFRGTGGGTDGTEYWVWTGICDWDGKHQDATRGSIKLGGSEEEFRSHTCETTWKHLEELGWVSLAIEVRTQVGPVTEHRTTEVRHFCCRKCRAEYAERDLEHRGPNATITVIGS